MQHLGAGIPNDAVAAASQIVDGDNTITIALSAAALFEGSQNLLFSYLSIDIPGYLTTPAGSFDPNLTGEYTFAITASKGGFPIETVAMDVQVIPLPTSLLLFGTGILGLAGIARRKS